MFIKLLSYLLTITECKCPSIVRVNAEIPSGADRADVSWTVPKPLNCPATLTSVSPRDASAGRGKFPIGEYEFNYHYEHSSASGTFSLACPVVVKVMGRSILIWGCYDVFDTLKKQGANNRIFYS